MTTSCNYLNDLQCINNFISFPFFLEEEESVEPPDDPDARKLTFSRAHRSHVLTSFPN